MAVLDHEKQIIEYEATIRSLKEKKDGARLLSQSETRKLELKLEKLKEKVYSKLTPVERLAICRHSGRPGSLDYIRFLCDEFVELHGDRSFGDDAAIIGGLCRIRGERFVIIGQEKGCDTESRLKRNFGMCHPEGFRKALRLMRLGSKFKLPVITLIDTSGAYPGLAAEERGQAWAIAENLREMSRLPTPIIVVVIGEAGSGGALALAVGDLVGMMEHGYYSVISPEGCASILWKDASKKGEAASALKLNSENLLDYQVIDTIIKEPLGGAHHDPKFAADQVREFILGSWHRLKGMPTNELLSARYYRFRKLGSHKE